MNQAFLSKNELLFEWKQFIDTGAIGTTDHNAAIMDSWKRSYYAGVDPYQDLPYIIYKHKSKKLSEELSTLISISCPIINQTYGIIKGSGFHLFLTDKNARLIECVPIIRRVIDHWDEDFLGTNAIGLAVLSWQVAQVAGGEHYCHALHGFTTSAAPILDSQGELHGVLGLIGPADEDHSHVLSALVKAADKMKDCLTIEELSHKYMSISESLNKIINSVPDGVMILDAYGVIEYINTVGKKILNYNSKDLTGLHFHHLSDTLVKENINYNKYPFAKVNIFLKDLNKKHHCETDMQMIKDENGHIINAIIFIRYDACTGVNHHYHRSDKAGFNNIMGKSKKLLESIKIARIAADNMSNILLQGESGTGKDIFAQAIHYESPRRSGPFVAVNCGAIPHELVSSELFGYVDGAFSGARKGGAPGKFEAAQSGTLFLDEISDMPLESQIALLRVLQDRKVIRIGDHKEIPVDIRIICATNRNLYEEVLAGRFREDLYYRINVISIFLPPLRESPEDIPLLIKYYLSRMGISPELIAKIINSPLIEELFHYNWPGNVRELQKAIERLVVNIRKQDNFDLSDVDLNLFGSCCSNCVMNNSCIMDYGEEAYRQRKQKIVMLDECERIRALMEKHNGNKSQVAREMGYSRVTLYRKLKLYGI